MSVDECLIVEREHKEKLADLHGTEDTIQNIKNSLQVTRAAGDTKSTRVIGTGTFVLRVGVVNNHLKIWSTSSSNSNCCL